MNKRDQEMFEKFKKGKLQLGRYKNISNELWRKIISMDATVVKKVKDEILTEEKILIAIESNPAIIQFLKEKKHIDIAIKKNPLAVRFLENYELNDELAEELLEKDITFLSYCPDKYWTVENLKTLIETKAVTKKDEKRLKEKDKEFKKQLLEVCPKAFNYLKDDPDFTEEIIKASGKVLEEDLLLAMRMIEDIDEQIKNLNKDKIVELFDINVLLFNYLPNKYKTEENILKCIKYEYFPYNAAHTPETYYQGLKKELISPITVKKSFPWLAKAYENSEGKFEIKDNYEILKEELLRLNDKVSKLTERFFESGCDNTLEEELDKHLANQSEIDVKLHEMLEKAKEVFGEENLWFISPSAN